VVVEKTVQITERFFDNHYKGFLSKETDSEDKAPGRTTDARLGSGQARIERSLY
jgi:hypothetical protein